MKSDLRPLGGFVACGLLIVLGLGMAACAATVAAGPVAVQAESLYCFSATIRHKKGHLAVGCFDQPALCAEARGTAKRWGGVAGVKRLSDCERWSAIGGAR